MALPTGILSRTGLTTTGDNVREDLTDIIYNISPTERPLHANIGRGSADNDLKEWLKDDLAAAVDDNAHVDGDDFVAEGAAGGVGSGSDGVTINGGERLGVYCQISRKDLVTSRRANITRKAGRKSERAYQKAKAGQELQRDCEFAATSNNATVQGNDTTAGRTAGLVAWIRTNTNRGATGTDPALSNTTYGQPTTAAGAGTLRALDQSAILDLVTDCYEAGGDPDVFMCSPTAKQLFSSFSFGTDARLATPYQDHGKSPKAGITAVGSVDTYVSDFGVLDVVPNRFQRDVDFFILDTELWEIVYLDGYHTEELGKTGDSEKEVMIVDWALKSNNEAGSAIYADVDVTTAMIA